jgi:hypothetical protein
MGKPPYFCFPYVQHGQTTHSASFRYLCCKASRRRSNEQNWIDEATNWVSSLATCLEAYAESSPTFSRQVIDFALGTSACLSVFSEESVFDSCMTPFMGYAFRGPFSFVYIENSRGHRLESSKQLLPVERASPLCTLGV